MLEDTNNGSRLSNDDLSLMRRRSATYAKRRDDLDADDLGATWSITSNSGFSRSSHDEGQIFPSTSIHSKDQSSEAMEEPIQSKSQRNEYSQIVEAIHRTHSNEDYFYDGFEEILIHSEDESNDYAKNEDDERLYHEDERISFTREQLVEYQQLTKLLRFVKSGGRCTTILSLALLQDHNLQDRSAFLAFKDSATINVMLNFLEMFDQDLKLNALFVLQDACQNASFAYEIFRLGGILTIIDSMSMDHLGIEESCAILTRILVFRRARRVIRRFGGISKLLCILDELTENLIEYHRAITSLCDVCLLVCHSIKNQYVLIRYGVGKILLKILLSNTKASSTSVISLFSKLLRIPIFRMQMIDTSLIMALINTLDSSNIELTRVLCESLYHLSLNSSLLPFIYQFGLKHFQDLLGKNEDPSIFCSIISILTEFIRRNESMSNDIVLNMIRFFKNSTNLFHLLRILQSFNELTKLPQTIDLFKQEHIFPHFLIYLHQDTQLDLQLNILSILEQCAEDPQSTQMIIDHNGLQQLWTLYKSASLPIRIAAGRTIRNCLVSIKNHGDLNRSFDGIFYLLLTSLSTDNVDLLAVTISIIAEIVKDEDNREILTDLGVVSKLSNLSSLGHVELEKPFCDALANLLDLERNRELFGNRNIMVILKSYLERNHSDLHRSITKAIDNLSRVPSNCVLLHDVGIAMRLLELIGSDDPRVQEYSANALRNMRRLLDANQHTDRLASKDSSPNTLKKLIHRRVKCGFT